MTGYFFDGDRREIVATWQTGVGGRARVVAKLHGKAALTDRSDVDAGVTLCLRLTGLSEAAWRTYTHGGGFVAPDEVNTEAWRLDEDRKEFAALPDVITDPGDPRIHSYSPLRWNAERVGHVLSDVGDLEFAAAIRREVEAELDAVARAELGDLSDRAAQAVVLSHAAASPTQVQAAWDLLASDLLSSFDELKQTLDPASAAVAAAAWLRGAAHVSADATSGGRIGPTSCSRLTTSKHYRWKHRP